MGDGSRLRLGKRHRLGRFRDQRLCVQSAALRELGKLRFPNSTDSRGRLLRRRCPCATDWLGGPSDTLPRDCFGERRPILCFALGQSALETALQDLRALPQTPPGAPRPWTLARGHPLDPFSAYRCFLQPGPASGRQALSYSAFCRSSVDTLHFLCYNVRKRTSGEALKRKALLFRYAKAPVFSKRIYVIMSAGHFSRAGTAKQFGAVAIKT